MNKNAFILSSIAVLATGCAEKSGNSAEDSIPAGAVPVSEQLYMVPIGDDGSGCPAYQPFSPTMAVVQAIHYRRADGSFTMIREESDCASARTDGDSAPPQ